MLFSRAETVHDFVEYFAFFITSDQQQWHTIYSMARRRTTARGFGLSYDQGNPMITKKQKREAQQRAAAMMRSAGILLLDDEIEKIEVVDFGLSQLETEGVQVFTMVNTDRLAAKVLVLFPNQTEPEHWHPQVGSDPGKQETVRHIWGDLRFYVEGEDNMQEGFLVPGKEEVYMLRNELILMPGDQLTFEPYEKHWFQAGESGAVLYSFSTTVRDGLDGFTDPAIQRTTVVMDEGE